MTRCFVCDRIKEEKENGWWGLWLSITFPSDSMCMSVMPLECFRGVEEASYKPTCGNNCAQKLVERWLTTKSFEAPKLTAVSA